MKSPIKLFMLGIIISFFYFPLNAQTAYEIIKKAEDNARGQQAYGEMKMTIERPKWTREIIMKTWTKGDDYSLVVVTSPARDKGTAFLKRDKEIWNWQPSIDRSIKMPPSMMMQSWMGSDFTNDDLVKQSSMTTDFTHELIGEEVIDGRNCYVIEMTPKPDAAVVWGKIKMWVDDKDFLELKVEFYDEDDYLVNTMYGKNIMTLGGRTLPTKLELIPADRPNQKTIVEQLAIDFDVKVNDDFFSVQNLKRVK
ncbi:MAG: outer membrane lipoprotein-sorting protein [Saprospiraceae bacterium]